MVKTFQHAIAMILCIAMTTAGCATTATTGRNPALPDQRSANRNVLAEYVQKLAPGTEVRIATASGHSLRGTLIKATDQSVFIQPKTRIAEPLVQIALSDVLEVTPERHGGGGIGRAIGAGAAAGAGATLAIFLVMFALYGD
jgi:hypothetical protein